MRISVVILVIAGIAAAVAAGLLVMLVGPQGVKVAPKAADVTVLVAKAPLTAPAVIDEKLIDSSVETQSMPRDKVLPNAVTDPKQIIGKVLVASLDKGAVITTSAFAADSSRVQFSGKVSPGMRAMSVNVSDAGALHGFLYPGATVDVLVAIKRSQAEEVPNTLSTTLLENIHVLGVEEESVVNQQGDKKEDPQASQARVRKVTLEVDMQQAKALQLAQDVGVISLAMRKPGDKTKNPDSAAVTLSQIVGLPTPVASQPPEQRALATATGSARTRAAEPDVAPPSYEQWPVTILRGPASETVTFPVPKP